MPRLLVAAVAVAALALASAAHAKGPVQVCGSDACVPVMNDEAGGMQWLFSLEQPSLGFALPAPSPFYVLRFADIAGTLAYWIPARSTLRYVGSGSAGWWARLDGGDASLLAAKTAGLRAFVPPVRVQAYVDGHNVAGDATYLRLFTIGKTAAAPRRTSWLSIWIVGGTTPWTDGSIDLRVARRGAYLWRDGVVYAIPGAVADRIRRLKPLG